MMSAFVLTVVLFINSGEIAARSQPVESEAECLALGQQVTRDLVGQRVSVNGKEVLVLDAQFACQPYEQQRNS